MLKLGFMASYNGSGMRSVLEAVVAGMQVDPVLMIGNNKEAGAFKTAKQFNLQSRHLSSKTHPDSESLDQAIRFTFVEHQVDLILLSGYMKKLGAKTLAEFEGRVLNIHPSLLPKFGGQGMYGDHVHQAVLDNHETETGATVHIVSAEYDQGPILKQQKIALEATENLHSIRDKVRQIEAHLYVDTLADILAGKIILPRLSL